MLVQTRKHRPLFAPPFLYTSLRKKQSTLVILGLLILQIAAMGFFQDFDAIVLIFCTALAAEAASLITGYFRRKLSFDLYAFTIGMMTGFFLPVNAGILFAFLITFSAYMLSWGVFGGKGHSWVNPIALAVCIAFVCKPPFFTHTVGFADVYQAGSVFSALHASGMAHTSSDSVITSALNAGLLDMWGVTLPEGYVSLFFHYPSPIPALRYNGLTLVSSIILLSLRIIDKAIPFTFLAVYGILAYLFSLMPLTGMVGGGDILAAWLTSGAFFSAFFVMPDCGSIPRSFGGRLVSGSITGLCAFLIAGPGITVAGIPFAVLLTNCMNPSIEVLERVAYQRERQRRSV